MEMKSLCVIYGVILLFLSVDGIYSLSVGDNCTLSNDTCPPVAVCDPRQSAPQKCLVKSNETCNATTTCVVGASCVSNKCACNSTYYVAGTKGICLSKSGLVCSGNDTCVAYSTCTNSKCTCTFSAASDGTCTSGAAALLAHPFVVIMAFTFAASYLEQSLPVVA